MNSLLTLKKEKLDVIKFMECAENLLCTDLSPHQRRILLVYIQHATLEITGRWEEIFDPRLTVERPNYIFAAPKKLYQLDSLDAVKWFYNSLSTAGSSVRLLKNEEIYLTDKGFMSEAKYQIYMRGDTARLYGHDVNDDDGFYIESRWSIVNWQFDERARMIGERVYPAPTADIQKIDKEAYWETAEVAEIMSEKIDNGWKLLSDLDLTS